MIPGQNNPVSESLHLDSRDDTGDRPITGWD